MLRLNLSWLSFLVLIGVHLAYGKFYESINDLPTNARYDFVIIGDGTAGPVIANRLTENSKVNVLLIEAGHNNEEALNLVVPGYFRPINTTFDWGFSSTPQRGLDGKIIRYFRGYVLGGGTSLNGMSFSRGADDNYDEWARSTGDSRWSWKSLWPYFLRYEKWVPPPGGRNVTGEYVPEAHGYNGNVQISLPWSGKTNFIERAIATAGLNPDINTGHPLGLTYNQATIGNGERCSAATAYLPTSVRERPNLSIVINTYATRVLPTKGSRDLDIRTVELSNSRAPGGNITTITASKELIISAGTFGTPHLLLNSGIGGKKDLEEVGVQQIHDLPHVGKRFSDHMVVNVSWQVNEPEALPIDPAAAFEEWNKTRSGPLSQAVGNLIYWSRIPKESPIWKKFSDPATGPNSPHIEVTLHQNGPTAGSSIVLLTPHSRGSIKIRSTSPFDPPLIDLGLLTHGFDLEAFKEGIRIAKKFFSGPAWDGYVTSYSGPDPDIQSDADFRKAIIALAATFSHAVGSASMSAKGAKSGVVDPDLRVKGVRGLRIVDASIFPVIPTAHTQAAVYVVAERAVDLIREAWR